MNNRKTVRNNGKRIGSMNIYNKNMKKIMIFGSYIILSLGAFALGRASKDRPVNVISHNTLTENYFEEPTYTGIPYVVKSGDTLSEIVYSYESDTNKVMSNIKLIEEYNGINRNSLHPGDVIYLVGVPASKLEDYGYTDNYNYFEPTVEVDLRLSFLNKVSEYVLTTPDYDENFVASIKEVADEYNDYNAEYIEGDEYKLDYIINTLRDLCIDAKDYGYSFESNLKALPLSEAEYLKTTRSY